MQKENYYAYFKLLQASSFAPIADRCRLTAYLQQTYTRHGMVRTQTLVFGS
jgi:hypothetical protein